MTNDVQESERSAAASVGRLEDIMRTILGLPNWYCSFNYDTPVEVVFSIRHPYSQRSFFGGNRINN